MRGRPSSTAQLTSADYYEMWWSAHLALRQRVMRSACDGSWQRLNSWQARELPHQTLGRA